MGRAASLRVGDRWIGEGHPCFIAAEIGINHNGDAELARRCIDAAAGAGCDAVKFQNYVTEDFVFDRTLTYEYESGGRKVVESQYDMFKRCELSAADLRELAAHAARRGVVFFSTPTSVAGVKLLLELGVPLLKNGSDFLTHLPLIEAMAASGVPTVLSTGMADEADVADAVAAFRAGGGKDLVLLHCTSSYPTPAGDVNLRRMRSLAERFECLVGFSDHTEGSLAAVASVPLGACMIEKHFTLDPRLPGPDHRFSSDPAQMGELVRMVRETERALGSAEIRPARSEAKGRAEYRLSCVAARGLPADTVLRAADIAFSRPGTGVPPKRFGELVGRRLKRPRGAGEQIRLEDVDG